MNGCDMTFVSHDSTVGAVNWTVGLKRQQNSRKISRNFCQLSFRAFKTRTHVSSVGTSDRISRPVSRVAVTSLNHIGSSQVSLTGSIVAPDFVRSCAASRMQAITRGVSSHAYLD